MLIKRPADSLVTLKHGPGEHQDAAWPECQISHPGLCHCTLLPLTGSGPELPLLPQLAGQAKCVWHKDVFYFSCSLRACLYVRDSRLARCRSAAHVQSPVILRNGEQPRRELCDLRPRRLDFTTVSSCSSISSMPQIECFCLTGITIPNHVAKVYI